MTAKQEKIKNIFKDDCLDIASDVTEFANLITQDKTARVYSISAKFGIGKSFFCDKLKRVLSANGVTNAIFNVWESDFYEDPIIPILSELNALYQHKNKDSSLPTDIVKHRSWWKIAASAVKINGKLTIPYVGEIGAEINGQNAVDECNRQDDEKTPSIYDEYLAYKTALDGLKTALKDWTRRKRKPAVLIIDELDRCRPDYAVKTLEVIKHFFNIEGLVFVLAIDEEQLENSVRCLFGTTDFDGYKRKFISNAFKMAEPNNLKFAEMLYDRSGIEKIIQAHQLNHTAVSIPNMCERIDSFGNNGQYKIRAESLSVANAAYYGHTIIRPSSKDIITKYFASFAHKNMFDFSLRKQEQVFDRVVLFIKSLKQDYWLVPEIIVFLACLHEQQLDKNLFYKFKQRSQTSSVPYTNSFTDTLDALMPITRGVSQHYYTNGWKATESLREGINYSQQEAANQPGAHNEPKT